jgi:hypothetical protein
MLEANHREPAPAAHNRRAGSHRSGIRARHRLKHRQGSCPFSAAASAQRGFGTLQALAYPATDCPRASPDPLRRLDNREHELILRPRSDGAVAQLAPPQVGTTLKWQPCHHRPESTANRGHRAKRRAAPRCRNPAFQCRFSRSDSPAWGASRARGREFESCRARRAARLRRLCVPWIPSMTGRSPTTGSNRRARSLRVGSPSLSSIASDRSGWVA